jgi:hypothetical protein
MIPTPEAVEGKQLELEELARVSRHFNTVMLREHVMIRDGQVVTVERRDPETGALIESRPVLDEGPGLQAGLAIIAAQKRRSALMGWDEPKKHEVSGPGGGPVQIATFGAELQARIAKSDEAAERMRAKAQE